MTDFDTATLQCIIYPILVIIAYVVAYNIGKK